MTDLIAPGTAHAAAKATFSDRKARELLLLEAYESLNDDDSKDDHPLWTRADAQWATKVASQTVGPRGSPEDFFAARAHAAMERLAPRDDGVRRALALRGWRWSLLPIGAVLAFLFGLLAYDVGTHQRIDLLSMPVWLVVAWNVVVYVLLIAAWVKSLGSDKPSFGGLRNFIGKRFAARVSASPRKAPALANFGKTWTQASWPMTVARAGSVLHVAAAALALGLVGGMYLRGLVLDYRAGWQSTFLEPPVVHTFLRTALAPASAVTGVAVPDVAGITALRLTPGQEAKGDAAPWIHLYAAALAILVIVPRILLALGSVLRGAWLARKLPLAIDKPYHQRLLQQHRSQHGGSGAHLRVHPHGSAPSAAAALALRKLAARVLGDNFELTIAPVVAYGREDAPALPGPSGGGSGGGSSGGTAIVPATSTTPTTTLATTSAAPLIPPLNAPSNVTVEAALFDLSATPEVEAQGRFMKALRERTGRGTSLVWLVDEAAFAARFGAGGDRLEQRRRAWRELAEAIDMPQPVFVNVDVPQLTAEARALEAALAQGGAARAA